MAIIMAYNGKYYSIVYVRTLYEYFGKKCREIILSLKIILDH